MLRELKKFCLFRILLRISCSVAYSKSHCQPTLRVELPDLPSDPTCLNSWEELFLECFSGVKSCLLPTSLRFRFKHESCNFVLYFPERVAGGSEREDDLERGQIVSEREDPGHDEVVQGHPQGHLLSAQDPLQRSGHLLHQKLVQIVVFTVLSKTVHLLHNREQL